MASFNVSSLHTNLSNHTSFFGIRLWVLVFSLIALLTLLILILTFFCIIYLRRRHPKSSLKIPHLRFPTTTLPCTYSRTRASNSSSLDRSLLSHQQQHHQQRVSEIEMNVAKQHQPHQLVSVHDHGRRLSNREGNGNLADVEKSVARHSPFVSDAWRGNRFALKDIEVVTNGFADENVIGNGDHGVVYRGVLLHTARVAVKSLLSNNSCQAEDFIAHVEEIGNVRHKNLVKLFGYCLQEAYRMLVNEYVDNGNLHQWLHGCPEQVSPLTWCIRMNIIQGIAKGLAYLHGDIEPNIVHQHLKSSNILLDHQWNPKISGFGIGKLFRSEWSRETACSMRSSGYLSQEYASAGVLNERTDVYSFGILVMEIISGRTPVDHHQPHVYLIDWLKSMVSNHKIMYVVDPKLPEMPCSKELKRMLLIALRCVDTDIKHRPTMRDVTHMLEPHDLLLEDDRGIRRDGTYRRNYSQESQTVARLTEVDFKHKRESSCNVYQKMMPW